MKLKNVSFMEKIKIEYGDAIATDILKKIKEHAITNQEFPTESVVESWLESHKEIKDELQNDYKSAHKYAIDYN